MLIPRPLSRALRRPALRVTAAAAAFLLAGTGVAAVAGPAAAQDTAVINGATTYQTMTGFGASEAFGEAQTVMNASASVQQQALSLLYSPASGAGLTMLRNEISADSGSTIEPSAPASPTATPAYASLASISQDAGQLWFAQQIKADYGVTNVFADAWSAPPFMKTNDSADNGGAVCGLPGATCSSGDWRQAYANYLVQYAKDYAAAGDPLTYIGPENEANLSTSDQKITNAWSGSATQSGANVSITNASYDGTIAAKSSVSLGFQGTWTSSDAAPTAFILNGTPCSL